MPFDMRWFQIFYLAFSTVFVGHVFGQLASLRGELKKVKQEYVWKRREVNKRMIEEFQSYEHDEKVDQYEFVVASLLLLDKVSSSDIEPIMDKFRELAGRKGFITMSDIPASEDGTDRGDGSKDDSSRADSTSDLDEEGRLDAMVE